MLKQFNKPRHLIPSRWTSYVLPSILVTNRNNFRCPTIINASSADVLQPTLKTAGSYKPEVRNIDTRRGQDLKSTWPKENGGCRMLVNSAECRARAIFVFILPILIKTEWRPQFKTLVYFQTDANNDRLQCYSTTIQVPLSVLLFLQHYNSTLESDAN
jgi:hypothetical protein